MKPGMRSELFMREDVEAILRAVNAAQWELAQHIPQPQVAIFRAGFVSALRSVATAMHIRLEAEELEPVAVPHIDAASAPTDTEASRLLVARQSLLVVGDPFWATDEPTSDQP